MKKIEEIMEDFAHDVVNHVATIESVSICDSDEPEEYLSLNNIRSEKGLKLLINEYISDYNICAKIRNK
jgi:hypothetical protein